MYSTEITVENRNRALFPNGSGGKEVRPAGSEWPTREDVLRALARGERFDNRVVECVKPGFRHI